MFDQIREFVNKRPWLGWAVAGVMFVGSYFVYRQLSGKNDPYNVDRMSETVTLKCVETGDEWEMSRGQMELELRERPGMVQATAGLRNPKTGKYTGFPFSKGEWEETLARLNRERQEIIDKRKASGTPAPKAKAPPKQ
jgi:hypothetical protein